MIFFLFNIILLLYLYYLFFHSLFSQKSLFVFILFSFIVFYSDFFFYFISICSNLFSIFDISMFFSDSFFVIPLKESDYVFFYFQLFFSLFLFLKIIFFDFSFFSDFFFQVFFDFYFFFILLSPIFVQFFFSPFFLSFFYYNFFYVFCFYSVLIFFFFLFFHFCIYFSLYYFFIVFIFLYIFSNKFVFFNRFFDFDFLNKNFIILEFEDLWVKSNFVDFDHNISYYKTSDYRNYKIKDRDSFYTLIHLFFNLNFKKTIFAEKGLLLKNYDKKLWTAFDVYNTSDHFENFLDDRGLLFVDDYWLTENDQPDFSKNEFWSEALKKQSLKNVYKQRNFLNKNLSAVKVNISTNKTKIKSFKIARSSSIITEDNFSKFNFPVEIISVYKPYYRFLRNAFNFRLIYFIWTTVLMLSKSTLNYFIIFLNSANKGFLLSEDEDLNFFDRLKDLKNSFYFLKKNYLPSTLDLYKVCEYFYSVSTFDSEFYEDFRHIARLKKIRDFYGDSIFNDLMNTKDHKPSVIARVRVSSETNAPFQLMKNEALQSEDISLGFSKVKLSSNFTGLTSEKQLPSTDSVISAESSFINNTFLVPVRVKKPGDLLQHLVSLYALYEIRK